MRCRSAHIVLCDGSQLYGFQAFQAEKLVVDPFKGPGPRRRPPPWYRCPYEPSGARAPPRGPGARWRPSGEEGFGMAVRGRRDRWWRRVQRRDPGGRRRDRVGRGIGRRRRVGRGSWLRRRRRGRGLRRRPRIGRRAGVSRRVPDPTGRLHRQWGLPGRCVQVHEPRPGQRLLRGAVRWARELRHQQLVREPGGLLAHPLLLRGGVGIEQLGERSLRHPGGVPDELRHVPVRSSRGPGLPRPRIPGAAAGAAL
jgi:hypothetical protein